MNASKPFSACPMELREATFRVFSAYFELNRAEDDATRSAAELKVRFAKANLTLAAFVVAGAEAPAV